MTYADNYNVRTTSVKFNDVADALDGLITRNYAGITEGTSTTYVASPTPAWDAYTISGLVVIIPHVTNTGAATINISGLGARDLKIGNTAIAAGVLQQNIPTIMAYTGTYFEVLLQNVSIPIGTIYTYAGASSPVGYLLCDGTAVSRSTYAPLFDVLGTAYGSGDGSTTFNLPDLRRRVPIGKGASDTLGGSDGVAYASRSATQTHSVPPHYHGMGAGATLNITSSGGTTTGIESAGHSHSGTTGDDSPDHGHSGSTDSRSTNQFPMRANSAAGNTGKAMRGSSTGSDNNTTDSNYFDHFHNFSTGGASARHQHSFSTGGVSANHTHDAPNHTHASGNFSGAIGLVTGGVDGNATMTSGAGQYLYINYIIKT